MVFEHFRPRGCGVPGVALVGEDDVGVCGADYDGAGRVVEEVEHAFDWGVGVGHLKWLEVVIEGVLGGCLLGERGGGCAFKWGAGVKREESGGELSMWVVDMLRVYVAEG